MLSVPTTGWALFVVCSLWALGCATEDKVPPRERLVYAPAQEIAQLIKSTREASLPAFTEEGLIFKYGYAAQNNLNTFTRTFSIESDSGQSQRVTLTLSKEELDSIFHKMQSIRFFDLPDTFAVTVISTYRQVSPHLSYYFGVRYAGNGALNLKELWWADGLFPNEDHIDERAAELRELISLIRAMVESKPEFRHMIKPDKKFL
jgi:hypothetical protein